MENFAKIYGYEVKLNEEGKVTFFYGESGKVYTPYEICRDGGCDNASGYYTVKQMRDRFRRDRISLH